MGGVDPHSCVWSSRVEVALPASSQRRPTNDEFDLKMAVHRISGNSNHRLKPTYYLIYSRSGGRHLEIVVINNHYETSIPCRFHELSVYWLQGVEVLRGSSQLDVSIFVEGFIFNDYRKDD